jgi:hypothetical protein
MLQEYEDEIMRLEKLNATLSANVSALYAENAAVEEEHHNSVGGASFVKGMNKQTSMEISVDEEYAPPDNDMILTEDQYLHEITKLQKSNIKFRKQFETQKKLVAKLSLHLKTSADKITALNKEKDEWKTKFENNGKSNGASFNNTTPQDDQNEVHKYQIQVIQNELIALQNLMSKNSKAHGKDQQRLLDEYRNEDALWTSKLERPMDTMKRIIRSLGTGDNNVDGAADGTAVASEEVAAAAAAPRDKTTWEKKGSIGIAVLDSVTSLFGQNQYQRRQSKVQIDEHPLSEEIKTYDVTRLKKTVAVADENPLDHEQEETPQRSNRIEEADVSAVEEKSIVKEEILIDEHHDEDNNVESSSNSDENSKIEGASDFDDGDDEIVVEEEYTPDYMDGTSAYKDDEDDSVILLAKNVDRMKTGGLRDSMIYAVRSADQDDDCAENVSTVKEESDTVADRVEVLVEEDKDGGSDEESCDSDSSDSDDGSMYQAFEGKYIAKEGNGEQDAGVKMTGKVHTSGLPSPIVTNTDAPVEGKKKAVKPWHVKSEKNRKLSPVPQSVTIESGDNPENTTYDRLGTNDSSITKQEDDYFPTEMRQVDFVPNLASVKGKKSDNCSQSMGTHRTLNTFATGITNGTQARITGAKEEKAMNLNDEQHNEDGDDARSMSHYQNIISQFTRGESTSSHRFAYTRGASEGSQWSKTSSKSSLSRKQLFQREGLSCSDLFVDVVEDVFNKPEERKVLVASKNGRDVVPPYEPPSLPAEKKKDAPIFKRGMKDGYYMYKSSSGNEYSGHWKAGRRHGYGMAKYRDGEVFHGDWRRGRRHGHGVLHLANKDVFDGGWDTNQKHGIGIYYWNDGEVDISWYEKDVRSSSVRWNKDRRLAFQLDLKGSKKEQISLNKAAKIVKEWEKKAQVFDC